MLFAKKSFEAAPAALRDGMRARLEGCARPDAEEARTWLVFAGQIEQAVRDSGGGEDVQTVTDRAAELFLAVLNGEDAGEARSALRDALRSASLDSAAAEVRIPEGFAWYGLYPESHAAAAGAWAAARWRGETVLAVGLRSIGTALSAVAAAALARRGAAVRRMTLRPEGHPFRREAVLPDRMARTGAVLVVDEGPGLSGSSMAGVAEALAGAGFAEDAIAFLPGHARGPGAMVGERERRWWTQARCWTAPAPALQRAPQLRWIFGGLAAVNAGLDTLAEVKQARQARLAAMGLACPCPGLSHGWIGLAESGVELSRDDLSPDLLRGTLAPYIALAALRRDGGALRRRAIGRIAAALCAHDVADVTERVFAACSTLPLAGDGRMAPEQWLRGPSGIVKRDATGTDCDHSWAGAQSVLWDVAGAMAEWEMDEAARGVLRQHLHDGHGLALDPLALAFHEAGYCALQRARAEHEGCATGAQRFDRLLRAALARMETLR